MRNFSFLDAPHFRYLKSLFVLLLFIGVSFYFSYLWVTPPPEKFEIKEAYQISADVSHPDALDSRLRERVSLPDWDAAETLNSTSLWYLIPLQDQYDDASKKAIYLPRVSQNVEVFLNGHWLGNGGNMSEPITRNRNNTLLFSFDSSLLQKQNMLAIHLVGQHDSRTYLGEVYIGPHALLRENAQLSEYVRIDLSMIITVCMLLTSILMSIIWVLRQSDIYYLYYAVFSALWAFHDSNHFIQKIPFSVPVWETLMPLSFGVAMLGMVLFVHRTVGTYRKVPEQFCIGFVVLLALPFLNQDLDWILFYAYHIWSPCIALIGLYLIYFLNQSYLNTGEERLIQLIMSAYSVLVFGMNDILLAIDFIPKQSPYMMHFAVLFTVVSLLIMLINRFVQSMNVVEHYNQELQHEISRKTDEIDKSYRQVQHLMRKYTVAEERQRIMRDIHDGIGGQLVATLVSMEGGPVNQAQLKSNLKGALQDLRMVIDSLDDEAEDLPTLLGMLRMRLSEQFANADMKLHWQVDDLPRMANFGPANVLNTMRIIQEAITNAIKHSGASNLTISTSEYTDDDQQHFARIEVADDGQGLDVSGDSKGRGLLNMQKRADLIGAKLTIVNADIAKGLTGTTVQLDLPIGGLLSTTLS